PPAHPLSQGEQLWHEGQHGVNPTRVGLDRCAETVEILFPVPSNCRFARNGNFGGLGLPPQAQSRVIDSRDDKSYTNPCAVYSELTCRAAPREFKQGLRAGINFARAINIP